MCNTNLTIVQSCAYYNTCMHCTYIQSYTTVYSITAVENIIKLTIYHRYELRVQGMQLRLAFAEKKGDLEPALKTFHGAVNGELV